MMQGGVIGVTFYQRRSTGSMVYCLQIVRKTW